ncbi:MAG: threonine synthase [Chloroflexi bacterium]|nr:threonine synthase [Chloroflexota bacterium]
MATGTRAQTLLEQYRDFLPLTPATPRLTLGEGNTPLLRSRRLEKLARCGELYFKLESCNPTGSFKDRGMVVAVAKATETGSKALICASTGNTSASAAAYGAAAGVVTYVFVPQGNIALGKLAQALAYGAKVVALDGNFDHCLRLVRDLSEKYSLTLVNSVNPHRIEGQKTAAFEIVDLLGDAPDYLFIPVGNAGNITAYWRGFCHYWQAERARSRPRMMGFEAEGAAPIVRGQPVEEPRTVATAIRIGNPASWQGAVAARDESGGTIDYVSDQEILEAYRLMAQQEGVFGEPASAAPLAGLLKLARQGMDFSGKRVVCIVTGSGLKDPQTALEQTPTLIELPADAAAIQDALGWR